ncbi:HAMP domain-containing sensor histidine kinase [Alkalihalobacillus sp. AL-G]|uniref:HAMP domain-containing sensor histidine kinase n=1 Tax=Alkalihalobacillus sp. AL-G TaxID=2926399 RepID=UPI00272C6AE5|nr:HAMP domain-containing sensor histidine kinase [Alkalihalobacillus sp. AL-G]WLD92014.1 HAMP domain-containing histidine kinase [Alkalihalobacillus sp. AL-G]
MKGWVIIDKISIKLGTLFLITILLIESILFIFLYYGLLGNRIDDEKASLVARGSSHRDVLVNHFDDETLEHVALMESEAETIVAITDENNNILVHSDSINNVMLKIMNSDRNPTRQGQIIEDRWRDEPYIASVSSIYIDNDLKGHVYMFLDTKSIRNVSERLTLQFFIIGGISIILTAITVFFLSRFITNPLIRMKKATEQINDKGQGTDLLDIQRKDELGDLARSIAALSHDLQLLKKERTEFLASIAHELRTPLTYLKGYADFANRSATDKRKREQYLKIIKEEADRLSKLVTGLFDLAKIDQHTFTIQKQSVNIVSLIRGIIGKIKPTFDEKGVLLDFKWGNDCYISIDEDRIKQVLINLLDNSLQYTRPGKLVQVKVEDSTTELLISVADEGEGIPEEQLRYIWDRLFRVDKSRSRKHGGTGIGLSIAKEIIEKHGGTIEAESTLGEGTVMKIRIKKGDG